MKRSTNRILTTHAGSLPRPTDARRRAGAARSDDEPAYAATLKTFGG